MVPSGLGACACFKNLNPSLFSIFYLLLMNLCKCTDLQPGGSQRIPPATTAPSQAPTLELKDLHAEDSFISSAATFRSSMGYSLSSKFQHGHENCPASGILIDHKSPPLILGQDSYSSMNLLISSSVRGGAIGPGACATQRMEGHRITSERWRLKAGYGWLSTISSYKKISSFKMF